MPTESTKKPRVAVITVTYNLLRDGCVASVRRAVESCEAGACYVVGDNGSTVFRADEAVKTVMPDARVFLRGRNIGFGGGNNFAAMHVEADYYFFLNPDTELTDPGTLDALVAFMDAHPDVGIVGPKQVYPDGRLQETCRAFPAWYMPFIQRTPLGKTAFGKRYLQRFLMSDYDHATVADVDWVQGSALFVRADIWKKIGGFDERFFMYFEDTDVCRRAKKVGARVVYLPDIVLTHAHERASAKKSPLAGLLFSKTARYHFVSWLKYLWKWKGR